MTFKNNNDIIEKTGVNELICQFSFKNFKSYKNETVFDLQAGSLPEFQDSLITSEKVSSLLPVSVVYGPNAGGKSTLLQALACLVSIVVNPIVDLGKNRTKTIMQQRIKCEPFRFDETSSKEPTEFNIYFRKNNNEYRYYIAVLEEEIISECLYRKSFGGKKAATIFEREVKNIELGASIAKSGVNTEVNPKMPYLSFLAINHDFDVITEVQEWFESCITCNYSNPETESRILISEEEKSKKIFIQALNDMGIDIAGYKYNKDDNSLTIQRIIDNKPYPLPFENESEGTKKLFASLPVIMIALSQGRLIIIDELDAKLHPKLLRYIISLFTNKEINQKGAQLIFSSHDMTTMKNDVFRRDEIWFAALGKGRSSELYSLYDIRREDGKRVNHTAAYDKQYLEGRYGADPYLRAMLDWEDLI